MRTGRAARTSAPVSSARFERAVAGETAGIDSWKIDRFSRFTEKGLRDLRRLEDSGARLAFVVEDIDTSGPMGKFVYTVMLAIGEYFLDTIKAGRRVENARAHERGAKIGPTPLGYRLRKDGTLEQDPEEAAIVAEVFERAARTRSALRSTIWKGLSSSTTAASARDARAAVIRTRLANRTYLGEVRWGDLPAPDDVGAPSAEDPKRGRVESRSRR
jgi:DNA invertase Pin-like site-specific DNA recombinase